MIQQGDLDGFWKSRSDRGDSIGALGLDFGRDSPTNAGVAVSKANLVGALRRKHGLGDKTVTHYGRAHLMVTEPNTPALNSEYNQIRLELAQAHIAFTDADMRGVPQNLSPGQIRDYHWMVFSSHGLDKSIFGGTMFTGWHLQAPLTRLGWCSSCDW